MADSVNEISNILEIELKYSDRYGIQYMELDTFKRISEILSQMRSSKELNGDQYHFLFSVYRNLYRNSIKYKNIVSKEPRYIAQQFIGQKKIRKLIFERDKVCLCCGSSEKLSIDHVIPVNKGGENTIENLQTLCLSCNSRKSDKIIDYRT